jgi:nucleoid-associated protein YgaU
MAASSHLGKLAILILDDVEVPGFFARRLEALFNPTELTTERQTTFAEVAIPGLDAPVIQYVRGNGQTLNVELFFDITDLMEGGLVKDGSSVRTRYIAPLERLMLQHPTLHAPPRVRLVWGATVLLRSAVATSLNVTYSLFDTLGRPVRATAKVGFKLATSASLQLAEMSLTSPDRTNVATVREGDTLPSIAFREYRDASRWRAIAEANGLSNPLALTPGTALVVPRIF